MYLATEHEVTCEGFNVIVWSKSVSHIFVGANFLDGYPQAWDTKDDTEACVHTCDFMRLLSSVLGSGVIEFINDENIFVNVALAFLPFF